MENNNDFDGWDFELEQIPVDPPSIPEPLERCPDCDWEGKSLTRHRKHCPASAPPPSPKGEMALDLYELKICWEALSRVLRQLTKNRSLDWKRGAAPVKEKLEHYLKKKNVIQ